MNEPTRETVVIPGAHTVRLGSVNHWFRWTGFRLCVGEDPKGFTLLGVVFFGWSFLRRGGSW